MAGEMVLVIEDDPTMLRGVADSFRFKGYDVRTATDGVAGLEAALDLRPELRVLDIMLP